MYWAMKEKLFLKRNSAISYERDRSKKDERIYNYYYLYFLLLFYNYCLPRLFDLRRLIFPVAYKSKNSFIFHRQFRAFLIA